MSGEEEVRKQLSKTANDPNLLLVTEYVVYIDAFEDQKKRDKQAYLERLMKELNEEQEKYEVGEKASLLEL